MRVGVTGLASKAYRAANVETCWRARPIAGDIRKAAAVVADGVDANSDLFASADYRAQMARVYAARALRQHCRGHREDRRLLHCRRHSASARMRCCRTRKCWRSGCPAAIIMNRIGPDEYEMKMKMVISSVQGLFAGKVKIEDQNPPRSFKLLVEGTGKVGFMKGSGMLRSHPHNGPRR